MTKAKLSYSIEEDLLIKIKYIAYEKGVPLNALLNSFVTKYISNFEKENGIIQPEQIENMKNKK